MKKTWKGALALVLALVLSLSLCVPAMASNENPLQPPVYNGQREYNYYTSLGDSIAAGNGRTNLIHPYKSGENKFVAEAYTTLVRDSLLSRFTDETVRDEHSFQGAIAGWRVREVLYVLGEVEPDFFTSEWLPGYGNPIILEGENKNIDRTAYQNAIKNADAITIELGSNEVLGNLELAIIDVYAILEKGSAGTSYAAYVQKAIDNAKRMGMSLKSLDYLLSVAKTVDTVGMYASAVKTVLDAAATGVKQFIDNWDHLLKYIYEHNENDVDVVVISTYNVIKAILGDSSLSSIAELAVDPFLNAINYEMQYGSEYAAKYTYIDATDLDMSDSYDGFHPGDIGHEALAKDVVTAFENFNHCQHEHTFKLFRKFATPFKAGYTGDEFCMDCGTFLNQGSIATSHGNIAIPRGLGYAVADKVLNTVGQTVFRIFEKFGK